LGAVIRTHSPMASSKVPRAPVTAFCFSRAALNVPNARSHPGGRTNVPPLPTPPAGDRLAARARSRHCPIQRGDVGVVGCQAGLLFWRPLAMGPPTKAAIAGGRPHAPGLPADGHAAPGRSGSWPTPPPCPTCPTGHNGTHKRPHAIPRRPVRDLLRPHAGEPVSAAGQAIVESCHHNDWLARRACQAEEQR
jgi:hypothetical protein